MGNLWNAPAQQLLVGTSVAQNTFTAAKDLPVGENTTVFPMIFGGTLNPGVHIEIDAWGVASNTGTPTVILGLYYGLVAGTALVISTAKTTTTAMSNWEWHAHYEGRVVSTGTAGTIIGSGYWRLPTSLTAWTEFRWPETAPATAAIDTTINKQLSIGWTWSASSASNTVTCHDMSLAIKG